MPICTGKNKLCIFDEKTCTIVYTLKYIESRIIILGMQVLPSSSLSFNSWNFWGHQIYIKNFDILRGATKIISIEF